MNRERMIIRSGLDRYRYHCIRIESQLEKIGADLQISKEWTVFIIAVWWNRCEKNLPNSSIYLQFISGNGAQQVLKQPNNLQM